jgi:hypothetical protein
MPFMPKLSYHQSVEHGDERGENRGENLSVPGLRATSQNILWSTTKMNEACARPPHVA